LQSCEEELKEALSREELGKEENKKLKEEIGRLKKEIEEFYSAERFTGFE